jgi:hypothetical protein
LSQFKFYLYARRSLEQVIDISDDELSGMSAQEKQSYIREKYFEDWLGDFAEIGFREIEKGSDVNDI